MADLVDPLLVDGVTPPRRYKDIREILRYNVVEESLNNQEDNPLIQRRRLSICLKPTHYGSKTLKSTHQGEGITHSLARSLRSASLRCASFRSTLLRPLRSTPLRATPLAGSFVSEKVAM